MTRWLVAVAVASLGFAFAPQKSPTPTWTLVISGDADGYLSPCGCTAPMTGGIRRRATAIRQAGDHAHVVALDNGGLGGELGRQGELKAETAAQSAAAMDLAAVHLTERDALFGAGTVAAMVSLSGGRMVSTSVQPGAIEGVRAYVERGPFLIGGASAQPFRLKESLGVAAMDPAGAARALLGEAARRKRKAILMFSGDLDAARRLAHQVAGLGAIVYRSAGDPPKQAERVGSTLLMTPGERGKSIVRISHDTQGFRGYAVIRLGPDYENDPTVSRFYKTYLSRVDRADLLSSLPRANSPGFAGSLACGKCHDNALRVWNGSGHAHALSTLEREGHARDPDCVGCHVVGLDRVGGFKSRPETPDLAAVGCESCHGPGQAHALDPKNFSMKKVGAEACTSCHRPDQSPHFDFLKYWSKIRH